jgi:hypothetical protein
LGSNGVRTCIKQVQAERGTKGIVLILHDPTALPEGKIVSTTAGSIRMHITEFLSTIKEAKGKQWCQE